MIMWSINMDVVAAVNEYLAKLVSRYELCKTFLITKMGEISVRAHVPGSALLII